MHALHCVQVNFSFGHALHCVQVNFGFGHALHRVHVKFGFGHALHRVQMRVVTGGRLWYFNNQYGYYLYQSVLPQFLLVHINLIQKSFIYNNNNT